MRDFIYHAPTSLEEALSLLDQYGEDARPIAGGTAMVNLLKQNLVYADHLVGLGKVPGLRGITRSNGDLRIGALTKHREVETERGRRGGRAAAAGGVTAAWRRCASETWRPSGAG